MEALFYCDYYELCCEFIESFYDFDCAHNFIIENLIQWKSEKKIVNVNINAVVKV